MVLTCSSPNFEVVLTAPQYELSDGTIAMFWFPDQEVCAKSKSDAKKIVEKMIENEEIEYDLKDEDGGELTKTETKEAVDWYDYHLVQSGENSPLLPEVDDVNKL